MDTTELIALVDHIEADDTAAKSPRRQRIETLMRELLRGNDGEDEAADAVLIRKTAAGQLIELSAREVGFVLGFEYCRDLGLQRNGDKKGGGR